MGMALGWRSRLLAPTQPVELIVCAIVYPLGAVVWRREANLEKDQYYKLFIDRIAELYKQKMGARTF